MRVALLWIVGTVVSVIVGITAVGFVSAQVVEEPARIRLADTPEPSATPTAAASGTASPAPVAAPTSVTPSDSAPNATPAPPLAAPAATAGADPDGPGTSPTPVPSPRSDPSRAPAPAPSASVSPAPDDDPDESEEPDSNDDDSDDSDGEPQPVTRTVSTEGGTATFRFVGEEVELVGASPRPGFTVDANEQGNEVEVRFESDDHETRIEAFVVDGEPVIEVDEEPSEDEDDEA